MTVLDIGWVSEPVNDYDMDGCADSTEDNDDDNDGVEDNEDSCPKEKSDGSQSPILTGTLTVADYTEDMDDDND